MAPAGTRPAELVKSWRRQRPDSPPCHFPALTSPSHPMPVLEEPPTRASVAAVLNTLVAENLDAARRLREAADRATTGNLRVTFLRCSTGHEGFARELLAAARSSGLDLQQPPASLPSGRRRAWLSIRTAVSLADDLQTIREAGRCGKRLVAAYHHALRDDPPAPPRVESVLRRQADAVAVEYDRLRSLFEIHQTL